MMHKRYVIFGITANFFPVLCRIDGSVDVVGFSDNKESLWGKHISNDERICVSPQSISEFGDVTVIVLPERRRNILAIQEQLSGLGLSYVLARDLLNTISEIDKPWGWLENIQYRRIHKFIDISLGGTTTCNFHCAYCYVWRRDGYSDGVLTSEHTPKELRESLKLRSLGGPCFINICARGETLLSKDIVTMVYELLEEGHVVSIVTNGTVKTRVNEILRFPDSLLERLFFKISFHYEELVKTGLMGQYWEVVNQIKESPCSYTLEITPFDGIESSIEDIKELFREKANGAMPHISVPRDATLESLDLLSARSIDSFSEIWSIFSSKMFDLKRRYYGRKVQEYCWAGNWSYLLNLPSGNLKQCYRHDPISNVFDKPNEFPVNPIMHECKMPYCINNHAFIAWGCIPAFDDFSYFDMRDRTDDSGNHWVKPPLEILMSQKLYDNNFSYADQWEDYHRLFEANRPRLAVLFNGPDYNNLGDHAIAMATRQFFSTRFPDIPLTEISCEEYEKENLRIKSQIKDNDLLLINGGGNIGSLWIRISDYILDIIDSFPNNPIIIFPQSLFFEDNQFGRQEERFFTELINKHKRIKICFRDRESYGKAQMLGWNASSLLMAPDMALLLRHPQNTGTNERVLCCFRDDIEYSSQNTIREQLDAEKISYSIFDTAASTRVFLNDRSEKVQSLISDITSAGIVLTDRLHAMIFCYITATPCIYVDNTTGKLSAMNDMLGEPGYIKAYSPLNPIGDQIKEVISSDTSDSLDSLKRIEGNFTGLEEVIRSLWGGE